MFVVAFVRYCRNDGPILDRDVDVTVIRAVDQLKVYFRVVSPITDAPDDSREQDPGICLQFGVPHDYSSFVDLLPWLVSVEFLTSVSSDIILLDLKFSAFQRSHGNLVDFDDLQVLK
jgi:hypothetical protein